MGHRNPFCIGIFLCFFGILSAETTDNSSATVEKTNTPQSTTNSAEKKAAEKVDNLKENAGPETAEISENKQPSKNAANPSKEKHPTESTKSLEEKKASTTTDSSKENTSSETSDETEEDALLLEDGDELILDGGEEYILYPESTKTAASDTADSITSDTAPKMSESGKNQDHITSKKDTSLAEAKNNETPPPKTPIHVEKAGSINFARNLKEYRSPKLAMLLSLFFPGAGQAYAKGYVKTAAFVATESAILGVSAYFSVKARNKRQEAHDFADKHYEVTKFKAYYRDLYKAVDSAYTEKHANADTVDDIMNTNFMGLEHFYSSANKKSDYYYGQLEDNPSYVQGWDDCEPSLTEIRNANNGTFTSGPKTYRVDTERGNLLFYVETIDQNNNVLEKSQLGFSDNLVHYQKILDDANRESRTARDVFSLILINHIASAIDAGITAKAYNDKLLGKESFWQKINIEQQYVESATGEIPGLALKVKF